jgi:superfamily II helicase
MREVLDHEVGWEKSAEAFTNLEDNYIAEKIIRDNLITKNLKITVPIKPINSTVENNIQDLYEKAFGVKTCIKCGYEKQVTEFYKNAKAKDKLQSYCKDCMKESSKQQIQISTTTCKQCEEFNQLVDEKEEKIQDLQKQLKTRRSDIDALNNLVKNHKGSKEYIENAKKELQKSTVRENVLGIKNTLYIEAINNITSPLSALPHLLNILRTQKLSNNNTIDIFNTLECLMKKMSSDIEYLNKEVAGVGKI